MKSKGPLLTLAVVAVLGLVLLMVNMSKEETEPASPAATSQVTPAPAPPAAATTTQVPPAAATTPFPPQADYVADVPTQAGAISLSITVEGDRAIAYACDGNTVESWLQGSAANGVVDLTGKNNARLEGRNDGSNVGGTLWIGDKEWDFAAAPVQSPAGIYVYQSDGTRQSWVVDQYGDVTGVERAADGATSPAPELSTDGTAIINGQKVTANKVSGGDSVF